MGATGSGTRSVGAFVDALALTALVAIVAAASYLQAFSTFQPYDDEGYLMLSVRHVLDGHRLYDEIRVTYGPLYYLVRGLLHGPLHVPLSHDAVRLTALAARLLAAGLAAAAIRSATRHVGLAALAFLLAAMHLGVVTDEPGHPQELVAVLLIGTVLCARRLAPSRATSTAAFGVLAAATAMLKLNLGLFTGLALWLAMLSDTARSRATMLAWCTSVAIAALLPLALVHERLSEAWAAQLVGATIAGVVGTAALAVPRPDGTLPASHLVAFVLAALVGVLLAMGPLLAHGTSPVTVYDRIVVGAGTLAAILAFGFDGPPGTAVATALGAIFALLARAAAAARSRWLAPATAIAKAVVGVGSVAAVVGAVPEALIDLAAPFAWLVLVRSDRPAWTSSERRFRLVLAWLAVLEPLQVYPVAGSQRFIGSLALLLCGVLDLGDVIGWAAERWPRAGEGSLRASTVPAVLVAVLLLAVVWLRAPWIAYASGEPLSLPGATRLHLPPEDAQNLRSLVATLRAHCRPFTTYAGFNSLYFWTEQAPPTLDLLPHDIRLVVPERRAAVVTALAASPSSCFVRVPGMTHWRLDPDFQAALLPYFALDDPADPSVIWVGDVAVCRRRQGPRRKVNG